MAYRFVTEELALTVILSGDLVAGRFSSLSSAEGSQRFEDNSEVKAVLTWWLVAQDTGLGTAKLLAQYDGCLKCGWCYVEK